MEKYYTPEIEEFYVGFECELIDNDKTHKWSPIKCREETLYDVQSSHYNARVKYLDKDWSGYCQKDYELMKAVMYPWPIPLTHLTYKNIKHLISYTKLEALKQKDEKSLSKSILSYIK